MVIEVTDTRARQAREHHRASAEAAATGREHRKQRDRLICALRQSDPARWSYPALAEAVGCSAELVAAIVKGRVKTRGEPR